MISFYDKGGYDVYSEKLDCCPPFDGARAIEHFAFFLAFILGIVLLCLLVVGVTVPEAPGVWTAFGAVVGITIVDLVILLAIAGNIDRCGVKIVLRERRFGSEHRVKYYQFSDDPERDAERVNRIVKQFIAVAEKMEADDIKRREDYQKKVDADRAKSEACCTVYKQVMEKVKQE